MNAHTVPLYGTYPLLNLTLCGQKIIAGDENLCRHPDHNLPELGVATVWMLEDSSQERQLADLLTTIGPEYKAFCDLALFDQKPWLITLKSLGRNLCAYSLCLTWNPADHFLVVTFAIECSKFTPDDIPAMILGFIQSFLPTQAASS